MECGVNAARGDALMNVVDSERTILVTRSARRNGQLMTATSIERRYGTYPGRRDPATASRRVNTEAPVV